MHFTHFFPTVLACLPLLATATQMTECTGKRWIPPLTLQRRDGTWKTPKMVGSTVKVHWNVIYENNTRQGGYISDEMIAEQMKILNDDYVPVGINFELGADPIRTHNAAWFNFESGDLEAAKAFKSTTKIMDPAVLKIWTVSPKHVGFSYAPNPYFSLDPVFDGVIYPINSFANSTGWDAQGHLLTHEVGHWSGLNHTFDERTGCSKDPDSVPDTPLQQKATNTCSEKVYSCGNSVPDPANNYMNYIPDQCRAEFTTGQIELMHKVLKGYRGITPGAGTKTSTGDSHKKSTSDTNNGGTLHRGTGTTGSSSGSNNQDNGRTGSQGPGYPPTRHSGTPPSTNEITNTDADSSSTTSSGGNADTGTADDNSVGSGDADTQVDQVFDKLNGLQTQLADIQAKVGALGQQ